MRPWLLCLLAVTALPVLPGSSTGAGPSPLRYQLLDERIEQPSDLVAEVRAPGPGEALLCFSYRGPEDHDYVRFTNRMLSLVRVRGGKERELARPMPLPSPLSNTAALVVVKRRPLKIEVVYRGLVVLRVRDADCVDGQVGAASTRGVEARVLAADTIAPPELAVDFGPDHSPGGPFDGVCGRWMVVRQQYGPITDGYCLTGSGAPAVARWGWGSCDDYLFEVSARHSGGEGELGLAAYYQDQGNYLALLWGSAEGLRLVRVRDGRPAVLARKPVAWLPGQWYRLGLQVYEGRLAAVLDGQVCLEALDESFGRGGVALWVRGTASFDDVVVGPARPLGRDGTLASPQWEASPAEPLAAGTLAAASIPGPEQPWWAPDAWAWSWLPARSPGPAKQPIYWHRAEHYGDLDVKLTLPAVDAPACAILLARGAPAGGPEYTLIAERRFSTVTLDLLHRSQSLARVGTDVAPGDDAPLVVSRQGASLTVNLDGKQALAYQNPALLAVRRIGLQTAGGIRPLYPAVVRSEHVYDYRFNGPLVDWQAQAGRWSILGWEDCCLGRKHWLSGRGDGRAVLWNRRRFPGDMTLEYHMAPEHAGASDGSTLPAVHTTLYADGTRLHTGYTVLAGGWHAGESAILRAGRVVAETKGRPLPPLDFATRRWHHVRISRRGGRLSLCINGEEWLTYHDPRPLTGDRLALCTERASVLVPRLTISCARRADLTRTAQRPTLTTHTPPAPPRPAPGRWRPTRRGSPP